MKLRILPCGEAALRLIVDDATDDEQWSVVHRVADWLGENPVAGVYGSVPTYDSLLVEFDASCQNFASLEPLLRLMARDALDGEQAGSHLPTRFTLPVVYGGEFGPDLGFVADHLGITEAEVIALHTLEERTVRCLGGPAASCMVDGPAFSRPIPRLADPRLEVPPNAISVAGKQGVIGPVRAPSGWRLIGLSPVEIMDRSTPTLVPYRPGDIIRFTAIDASEWDAYAGVHLWELAA
ncbi:5-oxoprolinase subunit B family protein [Leifsonia shinshuensis]|uniref:Allophanate hydrolase subunit 1 n=1 Tax=Leifsonia shinshuensis TaxID=150026 RepID=A0A7G6YE42_9MICO|nr:carboxyltransferase domain-containing protein [Leifsonia shinshuensis]QNE36757.1 allophanate hydrolase subunit 1 [Leifsonia shinshuensis]